MSRNFKPCFGMCLVIVAILIPESANAGGRFCLQDGDKSDLAADKKTAPQVTVFKMAGSKAWEDSGISVSRGQSINIVAPDDRVDRSKKKDYYGVAAAVGSLLARIEGHVIDIDQEKDFVAPGSGTIFFRQNLGRSPNHTVDITVTLDAPVASLATSSPEKPALATEAVDLKAIARPEFANKAKNFEKSLSTVQGLMIQETGAGQQFGMAVDVIVQVVGQDRNQADFQRGEKIGKEMKISMEEAIRAVRARYPQWEERSIRFSFGDKYSEMGGGSAGATFALLTISLFEGFEIDPDFAVTGDILVNRKVKGVGAIPEKIRGGITDRKKTVAIPTENVEAVSDAMVKFPLETLWQLQIFSIPDLQTLIGLARTDRSAELTEAMGLFTTLRDNWRRVARNCSVNRR